MNGSAGRVVIDFASKNAISIVQATEAVRFEQSSQAAQSNNQGKAMVQPATAFQSDAIDFFFGQDNQLKRAVTTGSSQIAMNSDDSKSRTVITAGRFEGTFASENRLEDLVGSPSVQVITKTQGQPDRVIISRQMSAHFDVTGGGKKGIARVTQSGDVKYTEGQRNATAERAVFLPAEDVLQLSGSPRVHDNEQGITIAAQALRLNRRTGEITGSQNVKTTYNQMKPNSGGAMLASAEPIHATAQIVNANRNTGIARYSGGARLWQGANMVQAPEIIFDRNQRSLTAIAGADRPVQTVFVQTDKLGKVAPVNVAAGRLSYLDHQRKVVLEQGVSVKTPDTSVRAGRVEITLKPNGNESAGMASQVEQVVAVAAEKDNLVIEQENPVRRAIGERLIYTAEQSKFVLTGIAGNPPSIFDAEHGNVTGDSLTFYTRDDRVQVGSNASSRTITRTRTKDESKP
jgi:lipopolysaccharide export system protein LptA